MEVEQAHPNLHRALVDIVGSEHVLTDDEDREFFSQDIYSTSSDFAACVVRPGTCDETCRVVAAATAARFSVIARGGGTSYTGGLLPDRPNSVIVDTRRLDRVVEINADDMYVVVEAGCTWKELHAALKPHGLRPPFWGPLSGGTAVIGGSLSQNSILHGSALHGASAEIHEGARLEQPGPAGERPIDHLQEVRPSAAPDDGDLDVDALARGHLWHHDGVHAEAGEGWTAAAATGGGKNSHGEYERGQEPETRHLTS